MLPVFSILLKLRGGIGVNLAEFDSKSYEFARNQIASESDLDQNRVNHAWVEEPLPVNLALAIYRGLKQSVPTGAYPGPGDWAHGGSTLG
ncbi:hypothetical protein Pan216_48360 [Planctomycetes bacterium Pan216]|uniref:Uncharacterized protein n=1 Tax=Kolteria novifilia TaxID=2527975 RepID=A0A518BAD9_9BACT|nr:hypothetical protein Pan216_48360 [Planctomycetes bacterium Pan216]